MGCVGGLITHLRELRGVQLLVSLYARFEGEIEDAAGEKVRSTGYGGLPVSNIFSMFLTKHPKWW